MGQGAFRSPTMTTWPGERWDAMTTALLVRHADIDLPAVERSAIERRRPPPPPPDRKSADYLNIAQSVTNFAQQVHDPGPVFS